LKGISLAFRKKGFIIKYQQKPNKMTKGRFNYEGCPIVYYGFSTLKESMQWREVNILINLDYNENYINF